MKQNFKTILLQDLHFIWLESRIDAPHSAHPPSSSLSFYFFLSLSLSPSICMSLFLPLSAVWRFNPFFSFLLNSKYNLTRTETPWKRHVFFYIYIAVDLLPVPALHCILKKGFPELFRQGQFADFGKIPSLFYASMLGSIVTIHTHITHPRSNGLFIPRWSWSILNIVWDKCSIYIFVIVLSELKCCQDVLCSCNIKHTSTPHDKFIHDALGSSCFIAAICNMYFSLQSCQIFIFTSHFCIHFVGGNISSSMVLAAFFRTVFRLIP